MSMVYFAGGGFEKDLELVTGDDTADFSKQGDYDALPGSNNYSVLVPLVFIGATLTLGVAFSLILMLPDGHSGGE